MNNWCNKQPRTAKQTFMPRWTRKTVIEIIDQLKAMHDIVDIQYSLVKRYQVSIYTARNWVEIGRRVMKDMSNGLKLDEALARDKERRNLYRRKKQAVDSR